MKRLLVLLAFAASACSDSLSLPLSPKELGPRLNTSSADPATVSTSSGLLDAGDSHTCALRKDGSVACWGYAPYGQSSVPQSERPAALSASFGTTCGLRADGSVGCWGSDGSGQVDVVPGSYTQVSAGAYSVCAIKPDKTVVCWGSKDRQQHDLPGTYTDVSAGNNYNCGLRADGSIYCTGGFPVPSEAGTTYLQVSLGGGHACAIRANRTIACWGNNHEDQVGGAPTSGTFTQVSSGNYFACALRDDGQPLCWGSDGDPNRPITKPPAGPFVRITAGGYHACAQRATGAIVCWGRNNVGQLNVPSDLAPPTASTASGPLDAGDSHTCVLRKDNSVSCWGHAPYGQMGIPSTERPTQLSASYGTTCGLRPDRTIACWGTDGSGHLSVPTGTFSQASAGSYGACGLLSSGEVTCWGGQNALPAGPYKEVATGNSVTCGLRADGQLACTGGSGFQPPPGQYLRVTIGHGSHACAIRSDGTLACWGSNQNGQLEGIPTGTFTQVSAGGYSTCALRETGEVACWGYSGPGSDGMTVPPSGKFVRITHGTLFACAQREDDSIVCWGRNDVGQLNVPSDLAPRTVSTSSGPVDAGWEHTCAVRPDGSIACWGAFPYGQNRTPASERAVRVSASYSTTCILRGNGTIGCWGSNGAGEQSLENVVAGTYTQVTTGFYNACGIRPDQTVACWGGDEFRLNGFVGTYKDISLGDLYSCALRTNGSIYCTGGMANPPAARYLQLSVGQYGHACAIRSDATITCWGSNQNNQLVGVPTTGTFTQVSAGNVATCALRSDGEVLCWGYDGPGGGGVVRAENIPPGPFVHLTMGGLHACAQRASGKIVCWGLNDRGQATVPPDLADNSAPTVSAGGPYAGTEGSVVSFNFSASDPNRDALTYAWDLGDGTTGSGPTPPPSHAYLDNGDYTVTLSVTDGKSPSVSATAAVIINNAAPEAGLRVVTPSGAVALVGETVTFGYTMSDPGANDGPWFTVFDWKDGTSYEVNASGVNGANGTCPASCATHTYTAPGTYDVTFSFKDKDGATGSATIQVVVHRLPVADAGAGYSGLEGSPIAFNGSASDPDGDAIVTYEWDFGDGTTATGQSVMHAYGDNGLTNPGTYTVRLIVTDARGGRSAPSTTTATVANVAPRATFNAPTPVNEGAAIGLSLTNQVDAPGDLGSLSYAFDCGGGTGLMASPASSASCPVTDGPATFAVRGRVTDKDGASSDYSASVEVRNMAPTVQIATGQATTAAAGALFKLTFTVTDAGARDAPWHYSIDWTDTNCNRPRNQVNVTGDLFTQPASATVECTYKKAGTYSVRVQVTDRNGGVGTAVLPVTVR
ncbi:MAG: PKD domain-containing protein [Gemmatimonadota bacterium]|nr:PKD domain-containing protein [Gemmatimonadota bacterium]